MKTYGRLTTRADHEQKRLQLMAELYGVAKHSVDLLLDVTEFEAWELRAAWFISGATRYVEERDATLA
ncbi:hypothetical protein QWY82_07560 [Simiduia curdlanivorans]|uniref:Uncharacterized protein n=2 Tax=Simiduia curdlanivorans TaxID=1492769 RepID=A0ABV8V5Y2_9GAMM|nr:hypothetical protein [Simiduia curdlanivorans]MDN3638659.1 hypothetical protein [Simiduia curdlanivorans]